MRKIIVVLFVDGFPKGIVGKKSFLKMTNCWWDSTKEVEVSQKDWEDGNVTISNIKQLL